MATLQEYLTQLNCSDSQQGIWVDPANVDDFVIRPVMFGYNAQSYGDRVLIGTLDNLSFGFQSEHDAFACWVSSGLSIETMPRAIQTVEYNGRKIQVNPEALYEAWTDGNLEQGFSDCIQEQVNLICSQWADDEAHDFVANQLPQILANQEAIA